MTLVGVMGLTDVLRLVAVPVLGWAALRDVRVRRVPTRTWYPLVALGVVLLAVDAWWIVSGRGAAIPRLFLLRVGVSLGVVAPFAYLIWRLGAFGGADAKALIALAVLFPTYPRYLLDLGALGPLVLPYPLGHTTVGVFSLTILTNTVLLGASYPLVLTVRNLLAGDRSWIMLFGRPVPSATVDRLHGSLLETPEGYTRRGLDVDALRMYLRWRGTTLDDLLADPDRHRDPASLPAERNDPGDGSIAADGRARGPSDPVVPGTSSGDGDPATATSDTSQSVGPAPPSDVDPEDEWGAAAFLADVGWGAYGTDPRELRSGLEVLAGNDEVWYSPGIPFIVPMFVGLVAALTLGDLLFYVLRWLAFV